MGLFTSLGRTMGVLSRKAGKPDIPKNQSLVTNPNVIHNSMPPGGDSAQSPQFQPGPGPSTDSGKTPQTPLPGKNGYTPTTAPYGMDQSNPGVQEQFWNQNQNLWTKGAFGAPGQGQQFWNQVSGNFNEANKDLTPQFNAYYDQAKESALGTANKQSAARGVYGSSQALSGANNIISDIEGQRAKASTDFMFNNAANQRANLGQYGDMAFGAENFANQQRGLDQSQLNSAYNAAGAAQSGRNNRIQNQFNNQATMTGMYLPFLSGQYDSLLDTDMGLVTGSNEANIAGTSAALANQGANRQQNTADASLGLGLYGAFSGGGGGQSPPQNGGYGYQNPYSVSPNTPY